MHRHPVRQLGKNALSDFATRHRAIAHVGLCGALVCVVWLNPFRYGPGPAASGWLFSFACCLCIVMSLAASPRAQAALQLFTLLGVCLITASGLSAVVALAQYVGVSASFDDWISPSHIGEAYANLRQRNHFATLTNMGLAALLWWRFAGRADGVASAGSKRLFLGLAALLAVANAASGSRTGLLQLLLLGVCIGLWQRSATPAVRTFQRQIWLVAAGAYSLASLGLPILIGLEPGSTGILARMQDLGASCQSRRVLWANVMHLITQKPWWGWGWGELDFAHFITVYPAQRFCDILDNAHNLPLHLAVELGLPFATVVCALAGWLVLRQRPWREARPDRQLAWAVIALIGLHSLVEYPLWYGPFQMVVALAAILLYLTSPAAVLKTGLHQPWSVPMRRVAGISLIVAWVACAYAAWDYWRVSQLYRSPAERHFTYREETLQKLQSSWLFADYVQFAELTTTPLSPDNAAHMHTLALDMLHFSPEPKVASLAICSAKLLARAADTAFYRQRFEAAFPAERLACEQPGADSQP